MGFLNLSEILREQVPDADLAGACLFIYRAGSDALIPIFQDSELTVARSNPVIADAEGRFDFCYLVKGDYRVVLNSRYGRRLLDLDGVTVQSEICQNVMRSFARVQDLLEDHTLSYATVRGSFRLRPGDLVMAGEEGFLYRAADAAAVDHDLVTAGGMKLCCTGTQLHPGQFGVVFGRGLEAQAGLANVQAVNRMLRAAVTRNLPVILPRGAVIEVANGTEPVCYPGGIVIRGNGCTICARDDDAPVLVAAAWAENALPGTGARVQGLGIEGTRTGPGTGGDLQDGLVIYGSYGIFEDISVRNMGGRGIVHVERDGGGTPSRVLLTGNRLIRPRVSDCGGAGIAINPDRLGTGPDGVLSDPVVSGCGMIETDVAAGWRLESATVVDARLEMLETLGGLRQVARDPAGGGGMARLPAWQLPDPIANDTRVAATVDGAGSGPCMVIAEAGAWVPLSGGTHVHTELPGALAVFDDVQKVFRAEGTTCHDRAELPGFTDVDGQQGEWSGAVPSQGAVFCEFVAPEFGGMNLQDALFNIRLSGASGFHGVAAVLAQDTGRIGFGIRPAGGAVSYEEGPSFHPGMLHRLLLSYDLATGTVSVVLDGGSVFSIDAPAGWVGTTSDKILLWEQRFIGSASGFSGGARKIQVFDAGGLPA